MGEVIIRRSGLKGSVKAPASKSYTHRAIICASLAEGDSRIINFLDCEDTRETINSLRNFGILINESGGNLDISGSQLKAPEEPIELRASGTTYRFVLPLAALADGETRILVEGRLAERPIEPLLSALRQLGVGAKTEGSSVIINGQDKIMGGRVRIPGNISSQFISGLLFIAPFSRRGIKIEPTTGLESKPYVDMTISVMREFGIEVNGLDVMGGQRYKPGEYEVEGDYSSAAFLLAAGAISGEVEVIGLNPKSLQGDRRILEILKEMNSDVEIKNNSVITRASRLKGIDIDVRDIPDLVPILSVIGCFADGETGILNAGRLREKESDRLDAIAAELGKMDVTIEETRNGLRIKSSKPSGARINPHNDHRIAMACSIAGLNSDGETIIENSSCVEKSYPEFFRDLMKIGGDITEPNK